MDDDEYAAQANTIEIDDITPNARNQEILRLLKQNDPALTELYLRREDILEERKYAYVPDGANDLGWLGYYIANNTKLKEIALYYDGGSLPIGPFFNWVLRNKSLSSVDFSSLEGGGDFPMLNHRYQINNNLTNISMYGCDLRAEGHGLLSLAFCPRLEHLTLLRCVVGDTELEELSRGLTSCRLLRTFTLVNSGIGDAGVEALAPVLAHMSQLESLDLDGNSITARGCRAISALMQGPNSSLEVVDVRGNSIGNEGALNLSNALAGNCKLKKLLIFENGITAEVWPAFSKLLCDTSSVNSTFLSNHTLEIIGADHRKPVSDDVKSLLRLNGVTDKKKVAMIKVLKHHSVFNVQPFFEWELKVLPHAIDWLERASAWAVDFDADVEQRKLTTIYQFLRGMADMSEEYTNSLLRHELRYYSVRNGAGVCELHDVSCRNKMSIMKRV